MLFFILSGLTAERIFAQVVDTTGNIQWTLDTGTEGQTAVYSAAFSTLFNQDYLTIGSQLKYNGPRENATLGVTYTLFRPLIQLNDPAVENLISFNVVPESGLTFVPDSIAFDCERFGTDGGVIDVVWEYADGTMTTLQTGIIPARTNGTNNPGVYHVDITGLAVAEIAGKGTLKLYLYKLGNTKDVGIANVFIHGRLFGTISNITKYKLESVVYPENAGTITSFPVGTEFDEGTEITLTANRNFGFSFSHWANENGEIITTDNPYIFVLSEDVKIRGIFEEIETFTLDVQVNGGAKDYMITYDPSGVMVEGSMKYEKNTLVRLEAQENQVMTFTSWSNDLTNKELTLNMDEDKTITANYSAGDFIVGWDFYLAGNNGRIADFVASEDNQTSSLVLRQENGNTSSWLDKSHVFGGYEGRDGAVNWQLLADRYYFQLSFNATAFTDMEVTAEMAFNYNAHSVQVCEYSLDGINFDTLGSWNLETPKIWQKETFALPPAANNSPKVYIRWLPDYNSPVLGTPTEKEGTSISGIYIFGKEKITDDGKSPQLLSSIPSDGAANVSATGKIVLSFDEKIRLNGEGSALLGNKILFGQVSGNTLTFLYSGLIYNSPYQFIMNGGTVSDLAGNILDDTLSISFSTLERPRLTKKRYDFIVGVDGGVAEAFAAAGNASGSGQRFYIFFPNGNYDLGKTTGDATEQTFFSIPNVSFIGQDIERVILFNEPLAVNEGIATTPTLYLTQETQNIYMQDLTLLNKMDFRTGSFTGRAVALRDQGDRSIFKNVRLQSNQDTYYTGSNRSYWENGVIHGTVDYIFGGGDVFFNETELFLEDRTNNHITAAATASEWGYVFMDCSIKGFSTANGNYKLGRPWNNQPKTVFINTTMHLLPSPEGWSVWNTLPSRYAEYQSKTSTGSMVDLSNRRSVYTTSTDTIELEPVLTLEEAQNYTIQNVLGGNDGWQPNLLTEQVPPAIISQTDTLITWADDEYVLGWAVFENDVFVDFITVNNFTVSADDHGKIFTIRGANEMGGLGQVSNELEIILTKTEDHENKDAIRLYPNPVSDQLIIEFSKGIQNGSLILMSIEGVSVYEQKITSNQTIVDFRCFKPGLYFAVIRSDNQVWVRKIIRK